MNIKDLTEEDERKICLAPEHEINKAEVKALLMQFDSNGSTGEYYFNESDSDDKVIFKSRRSITIKKAIMFGIAAAAVFILSFEFTNHSGSVIADPDKGFFHWFQKDETGITFVTNPQAKVIGVEPSELNLDPALVLDAYFIPDNLPDKMVLYNFTYLPETDDYKYYYTDGAHYLEVGSIRRRGYVPEDIGYEYSISMFANQNVSDFYTKGKENLGAYPYKNRMYYAKGNLDMEKIQEIILELGEYKIGEGSAD